MSAARAHHRREARANRKVAGLPDAKLADDRPELPEGQEWAVLPCWAGDKSSLPEARRQSHDTLIGLMGDQRRGGIRWAEGHGRRALDMCHELMEGLGLAEPLHGHLQQIHTLLHEQGGYIVVAMAPGEPPS